MVALISRLFKMLGVVAATCVGIVVLGVWALDFFTQDLCANSVLAQYPAPGGRIKAVLFERDCGATTDFSTQISILSIDDTLPNEGGNIFVADSNHGKAPHPVVRVIWLSEKQLRVEHNPLARIVKSDPRLKGVTVEHISVAPKG
ncbi:hypothetical protein KIK84_08485 [Curvibacter sp. CHRR-16]|uniref:hypothetical protein n=1 Tax=Curvibacter sp. CHRR-16 TaxID=2835872 RepID=UPI001BD9A399|nr:hypothetical protein [Curvibacter sp. CHRR-16]MBT0570362.1 hypothetical protein [Curvibacter sp. CHRR-16]